MALTFQHERFADVMAEAAPLIHAHYDEVGLSASPLPAQPDFEMYARLEQSKIMYFYVARDGDGVMAGYAAMFLMPSPVFGGSRLATNHAIYLLPRHRSGYAVMRFVRFCEEQMVKRGADSVEYHLWLDKNFGPLLERNGYKETRTVFTKFTGGE